MDADSLDFIALSGLFKVLGEPTRLKIMAYICSCGSQVSIDKLGDVRPASGRTVGEVCCHLNGDEKVTSTVSHHLKELKNAGLITMSRNGRNVICAINEQNLMSVKQIVDALTEAHSKVCC